LKIYSCLFSDGGWDEKDWLFVKSPRWEHKGEWVQEKDHIWNLVPNGVKRFDLMGAEAGKTYTSMLYQEFVTDFSVEVGMSFDDRMAPLIVLSDYPSKDSSGYFVYRDHIEVVLFDKGINVWSHYWNAIEGPKWQKLAFFKIETLPKQRSYLEVKRCPKDLLEINYHGLSFEVAVKLPHRLHVGITGCEGINRFYEFCLFSS
tara:strand:+ start:101 stop:706 length:606 start_codon:yes stop_codon:yes gene_type:complete